MVLCIETGALAKYHCNYCDEDILDVRVRCAECADFDLCLQVSVRLTLHSHLYLNGFEFTGKQVMSSLSLLDRYVTLLSNHH